MSLNRKRLWKRRTVQLPREIVLPPDDYEATKAVLEEELVPPESTVEEKLRMFFRPTKITHCRSKV